MKARIAAWLRWLADRLDPPAPLGVWRPSEVVTTTQRVPPSVPPPPAWPPPHPLVQLRLVGRHGHACGNVTLLAEDRRAVLDHNGDRYHAERQEPSGVWIYRKSE